MVFRPQPKWLPLLRGIVVLGVIGLIFFGTIHGLNVQSTLLTISPYGLFVGVRTIIQLIGSTLNNRRVEHRQRRVMIDAVVQLREGIAFSRLERWKLMNMHDFRSFKKRLVEKHGADWPAMVDQVFTNQGFSRDTLPPVGIVIPTYGPKTLQEVIDTVAALQLQSYNRIVEIIVAFNQPDNLEMQAQIKEYVDHNPDKRVGWRNLKRASKRHAMFAGFERHIDMFYDGVRVLRRRMKWQHLPLQQILINLHQMSALERATIDPWLNMVTVNVDGDTAANEDAIFLGVLQLIMDRKIVAITSNVEISNAKVNFLTRITEVRYKYANVIERGYQSLFNTVRCMSGPLMILWTFALVVEDPRGKKIIEAWLNETFMGVVVGPGDDRSLTVRFNEVGLGVAFNIGIFTLTDAPISWHRWILQQLRWLRSAARNFVISLVFLFKLPILIVFDDLYLFVFPFLLLLIFVGIGVTFVQVATSVSISAAVDSIVPYITVVVGLNLAKSAQMSVSQRSPKYMLLSLYFWLHFRYLIWLRLYSIPTITDSGWLGRSAKDFKADEEAIRKSKQRPPPPSIWTLAA